MSTLLELAERVEAASGPDREIGREALLACGWRKMPTGYFIGQMFHWMPPGPCSLNAGFDDDHFAAHDPTTSLDAAVLLATGNIGRLLRDALERAEEEYINPGSDVLARFLTAACLRANAALSDRKEP